MAGRRYMEDYEPLPGAERERQRWGRFPVIAREALQEIKNPDRPPFPFESWAADNRFEYPYKYREFFFRCASAAEGFFVRPFMLRGPVLEGEKATHAGTSLVVAVPCRRYVIDAVVECRGFRLAIEIDGLTYHHRTRAQIAADYLRERRLVLAGFTVIRFTAPEVFANPDECWRQIDAILEAR